MKITTLILDRSSKHQRCDPPSKQSPRRSTAQRQPLNWLSCSRYLLGTIVLVSLISLFPIPAFSYQFNLNVIDRSSTSKPIQIENRSLIISPILQQEISSQIPALDRQLQEQSKLFSIPLNRKIGLVYLHQGRDCWKIEFTYGGYPINTTDETIYSTQEIFKLKQAFITTDKIDIAGKLYATSGLMRQTGPILHTQMACDLACSSMLSSVSAKSALLPERSSGC
jgi:hypothetical protein